MGIFEFIGESYNPGEIGTVDRVEINRNDMNLKVMIAKSIIAVGLLALAYVFFSGPNTTTFNYVMFSIGIVIYCTIAFFVVPHPDYDNIGWLGGLIDHPFRYSDDINRFLIFLAVILYPGRFISRTFMTWIYYFFVAED